MASSQSPVASAPPPVRAIAALLQQVDPETLAALSARFPEQRRLFDPAYVLGESDAAAGGQPEVAALRAFVDAGLGAAETALADLVSQLGARMRLARRVKLGGALVASISSVGVISALSLGQGTAAIATALVGLVSSVASLVGEHLHQPLVGGHKSLGELLGDALGAEDRARAVRLELVGGPPASREGVFAMASRVNEIAAQIRAITVFGGV